MAHFLYQGRDRNGIKKKGKMIGASKQEVLLKLREKGIGVTTIKEITPSIWQTEITIGSPVKVRDFVIYLRQFSTLLKAGVSIVDATHILVDQTENKYLKLVLKDIEEELRAGNPFSEAIAKHKKIFSSMMVHMIYAGEVGGILDETMERLAEYYEKQNKTRQKILSAMTYPVTVGFVSIGVVSYLLTAIVPTMAGMLTQMGGELPRITKLVLGTSTFLQGFWWIISLFVAILSLFFYIFRQKSSSKYYLDYAIMRLPIFGKVFQKAALARVTRTLSALLSSSVPILQALSIVEKVAENEVIARVIRQSRNQLQEGKSLTEPMKESWVFPTLVTQMIAIGEQTGALDAMLGKIAEFYEDEVDAVTDRIKALIEPLLIVIVSIVVGIIVIAIIVPMFEVYNNIGM